MRTINIGLLLSSMAVMATWAGVDYEAVVDDSVVGYWRFNDPNDYGKDSSGHGSNILQWNKNASGGVVSVSTDWSRGGGCLELPRDGKGTTSSPYDYGTAIATANGPRTVDLSSSTKGWTIATWIRGTESIFGLEWYQKMLITGDAEDFYDAMTNGKWHPIVVVFRPDKDTACYRIYVNPFDSETVTDVCSTQDTPGKYNWKFPVSISGTSVTLGGKIAGSGDGFGSMNADFFGGLDDCLIIDRELKGGGETWDDGVNRTNEEVFRLVQTGETFVFSRGSDANMVYESGNWSNNEVPLTGLAYMIENGHEAKASRSAVFAGKSLSVGRTEKLYGIKKVGGQAELIVSNTVGKLTQVAANTTMTFDDLLLNDGVLTSRASGQKLVANIRVRAAASKPFRVAVSNGTYVVSGTMKGDGNIDKVGPAILDLSGVTESTAKVLLSEGSLRLPAVNPTLSGYSGGTLLVDFDETAGTATTVTIASAWTGTFAFKLNGTPSRVKRYAAMKIPNSVKTVTTADFDNQTVCANGMTARMKVVMDGSEQTVFVECIPTADQGNVPVVIFE